MGLTEAVGNDGSVFQIKNVASCVQELNAADCICDFEARSRSSHIGSELFKMVTSFMKWTKERVLTHLLGRIDDQFLQYFVDLPGSFSWGGFMDRLELSDVCLDTTYISRELYRLEIPVRLKYGHIGTLKLNVSCFVNCHLTSYLCSFILPIHHPTLYSKVRSSS